MKMALKMFISHQRTDDRNVLKLHHSWGSKGSQRETLISLKCLHTAVKEDELVELLSITILAMELFSSNEMLH